MPIPMRPDVERSTSIKEYYEHENRSNGAKRGWETRKRKKRKAKAKHKRPTSR